MQIWMENLPETAGQQWEETPSDYRQRTRGAFRTWQKAVYGHANVVCFLLKYGFPTGDGGADTPAKALALAMHARATSAEEQRQEERTSYQQEQAHWEARKLRRDVRFGRLRERRRRRFGGSMRGS